MKFSISFKYQNISFKNKETKETIPYETKAGDGNSFAFDNVDEDVVIGMLRGIKNKKASEVFSYDDLRTNFINTLARNKCKELYDKLDKGEWKIEDIVVSTATLKDLEFTKPTMNARETLTVESKGKQVAEDTYGNKLDEALNLLNEAAASLHMAMWDIKKELGKDNELFKQVERNYNDVHETYGIMEKTMDKTKMNENFKDTMRKENQKDLLDLIEVAMKACKEIDIISNMYDVSDTAFEKLQDVRTMLLNALPSTKTAKEMGWCNESKEEIEVEFKKTPDDGTVVAFFPETMDDGSCNPGMIMSYMHIGQHSEASVEFYDECLPCDEKDYAQLLLELERIYDDTELVVIN